VPNFEELQSPLISMEQLAKYVGRHVQLLRRYFAEGALPEPEYRVQHKRKLIRRFTRAEADRVKAVFDNVGYGTIAKRKKNAALTRREPLIESKADDAGTQ
jgi:hypothetical protein